MSANVHSDIVTLRTLDCENLSFFKKITKHAALMLKLCPPCMSIQEVTEASSRHGQSRSPYTNRACVGGRAGGQVGVSERGSWVGMGGRGWVLFCVDLSVPAEAPSQWLGSRTCILSHTAITVLGCWQRTQALVVA